MTPTHNNSLHNHLCASGRVPDPDCAVLGAGDQLVKGGTESQAVDEASVRPHEGTVPVGAGIKEPNIPL